MARVQYATFTGDHESVFMAVNVCDLEGVGGGVDHPLISEKFISSA